MIRHASLPARDPARVAAVLAEVVGGTHRPFLGPIPGAFMVLFDDAAGTTLEVYPEDVVFEPGAGEAGFALGRAEAPRHAGFHLYISIKGDAEAVEAIGAREGWRVQRCVRGPKGAPAAFELVELWVENRFMIELATEPMLPKYLAIASSAAQDALAAALAASR